MSSIGRSRIGDDPLMKTIRINEELCDGCGECVSACVEGALELIDGKARLVREEHCDGLGACVGDCPRGAITLIDRGDAAGTSSSTPAQGNPERSPAHSRTDAWRAQSHAETLQVQDHAHAPHQACPGSRVVHRVAPASAPLAEPASVQSELMQWPIQLHLVPPSAPYFRGTDLLLAADCAAFARADFHTRFLRGRSVAIACPKLDDSSGYAEKLVAMMGEGGVRSVTIVTMEVPCCRGLERLVLLAARDSGRAVPLRRIVLGIDGGILRDQPIE